MPTGRVGSRNLRLSSWNARSPHSILHELQDVWQLDYIDISPQTLPTEVLDETCFNLKLHCTHLPAFDSMWVFQQTGVLLAVPLCRQYKIPRRFNSRLHSTQRQDTLEIHYNRPTTYFNSMLNVSTWNTNNIIFSVTYFISQSNCTPDAVCMVPQTSSFFTFTDTYRQPNALH